MVFSNIVDCNIGGAAYNSCWKLRQGCLHTFVHFIKKPQSTGYADPAFYEPGLTIRPKDIGGTDTSAL